MSDVDDHENSQQPLNLEDDVHVQDFERRLFRNVYIAGIVSVALTAVLTTSLIQTLSVALGAGLAILNYRWLHRSLKAILMGSSGKAPPGTAGKFILRYVVIGAVVWLAVQSSYFRLTGILIGLIAVMTGAAMIEAGRQAYLGIINRGE